MIKSVSYAFQVTKGIHAIVERIEKFINKNKSSSFIFFPLGDNWFVIINIHVNTIIIEILNLM